jgi:hypothetical protein
MKDHNILIVRIFHLEKQLKPFDDLFHMTNEPNIELRELIEK